MVSVGNKKSYPSVSISYSLLSRALLDKLRLCDTES